MRERGAARAGARPQRVSVAMSGERWGAGSKCCPVRRQPDGFKPGKNRFRCECCGHWRGQTAAGLRAGQEAEDREDRAIVVVAVLGLAGMWLAGRHFGRMATLLAKGMMVDMAEAEAKLGRERQKRQP